MKKLLLTLLSLCALLSLSAQTATITGTITDGTSGAPIDLAAAFIKTENILSETDQSGKYSIEVPAGKAFELGFSRIGYKETAVMIKPMKAGSTRQIDVQLVAFESGLEVVVTESRIEDAGVIRENMEQLKLIPSTTGNLESLLPSIALGVSSGTGGELSSQYNVRGGNYDENLVYVNDFEIYRPQLIRAGQQEGLTFANTNMVRDLVFSSGGFEAKYGDKLSSVLDIRYKRPDSLRATLEGSLLGGAANLEGSFKLKKNSPNKLRYLIGSRYKTTRYLLAHWILRVNIYLIFMIFRGISPMILIEIGSWVYWPITIEQNTDLYPMNEVLDLDSSILHSNFFLILMVRKLMISRWGWVVSRLPICQIANGTLYS